MGGGGGDQKQKPYGNEQDNHPKPPTKTHCNFHSLAEQSTSIQHKKMTKLAVKQYWLYTKF